MSNEKPLSARLSGAIPYVTKGGIVADVGTDHAYLPIELIRREIAARAIACDIGKGPLERARAHIEESGLSEQIGTRLTDGLHGVEKEQPTDVLVFGMGGELIAKILSEAPWLKERQTNLVLQPMTKAEVLRLYLSRNGFEILDETLLFEDRYYQILHARYTGVIEEYTEEELLLGKRILQSNSPHVKGFLERNADLLSAVLEGKRIGGADTGAEERLLECIRQRLNCLSEEME